MTFGNQDFNFTSNFLFNFTCFKVVCALNRKDAKGALQ